jgi:hypothetical protein
MNKTNVDAVRQRIAMKNSGKPVFFTTEDTKSVTTDYDTFPYPRWFRGRYNSSAPIVAEREAGFRQRYDSCYALDDTCEDVNTPYPNHCFEAPCSTVYPCYPAYLAKYSDKELLDILLNKACIVAHR